MADEPKWSYDVFLCFRGKDTRYSFTGNFFTALCKKKIKVFMDDDGLKSGDHINYIYTALEKSKVVIVVFSENFASSSYCLKEVAKIVQCEKMVLPIFCDVDPSDVYCESIKEALTELPKDSFPDMPEIESIRKWVSAKMALATSSHEECQLHKRDKYEHERIDQIVKWVTSKTKSRGNVFLSFREKDICDSFVVFLRDALKKERFEFPRHVVQTSPSLDESWLSIIVLSEKYASDPLCLHQLVTILDRMKKKIVLPIFFKVEASDIRHQTISFGTAMAKEEWRKALAEVANLKGYHLKSGYEFETIENIVKEVVNAFYLPSPT